MSTKLSTPTVLKKIIDRKYQEISDRKSRRSLAQLMADAASTSPTRGFVSALQTARSRGEPAVIAEVKKASPSVPGPQSDSTACSGCGINPTTLPSALATPAAVSVAVPMRARI